MSFAHYEALKLRLKKALSHNGRLGLAGMIRHFCAAIAWYAGLNLLAMVSSAPQYFLLKSPLAAAITFFPLAMLAAVSFFGILIAGVVRRCHDMGLPGWVGILWPILLLPGNQDENSYGPPVHHLK